MKVTIKNTSGVADNQVFLLLTGSGFKGKGIKAGTSVTLNKLTNNSFDLTQIVGGRLYISYLTALPANPVPTSDNYYGYLEFTLGSDSVLWVDLSAVDVFGVAMGFSVAGNKLGYQKSHNTIAGEIVKALNNSTSGNGDAVKRTNSNGNVKIVGANVLWDKQPSYASYLKTLKGAKLAIKNLVTSPIKYDFTGSFKADGSISLSATSGGDTFSIPATDLNDKTIYLSNGDCIFNGVKRNAMSPNDECAAVYRDIMIGINEGYFTASGANNSSNFPNMKPFANGEGNVYAKLIHEGSDAYGYPFSDKNLKTLINVPVTASTQSTLTILADDKTS